MWWLTLVELAIVFFACLAASRYYIHMFQLESYQADGYRRWLHKNADKRFGWTLIAGAAACALCILLPVFLSLFSTGERARSLRVSHYIACVLFAAYSAWRVAGDFRAPQKKPLVYTKRALRLIASLAAVLLIILGVWTLLFHKSDLADSGLMLLRLPVFAVMIAVPFLPLAAAKLISPVEEAINRRFFTQAQAKLDARPDLIKIGVTGSYGKTSTKFALASILSVKYRVLASKGSFNTPMGLSTVINNELTDEHQVFIAEMGARHVGDIRELVALVHPKYALLTSVGPQHLETFGDVETVAATKFELIEGLPADGCAFFAADDGVVDGLFEKAACEKYRAGMGKGFLSMRAEEIEVGPFGSRFTLCESGGARVRCETKLLGRHNLSNVLLCACAAFRIGLTVEEIAAGIRRIEPVEHRLQLMQGPVTVIDDAFNSNPVGAREALAVLNGFHARRIIVTPGFVELGEDEEKYNYNLGVQMASVCDVAVLVGPKRTRPILKGLTASGFDISSVHVVASLAQATDELAKITKPGDVVLFENDLPDNYSE